MKQSFLPKPEGVTVEDQMKIGMLVKQYADREKQRLSQQIRAAFDRLAEECKAHDLMDDKMVLNSAFLIRKDRQEDFDRQVEQLNAQFDESARFSACGSAAAVQLLYPGGAGGGPSKKWTGHAGNWGCRDGSLTAEAIKKAHRKVALTCHPDKNPNVPDIEKKFADMSRAYKILLEHYRSSGRTPPEEGSSGDEPTLEENAIVVATMK